MTITNAGLTDHQIINTILIIVLILTFAASSISRKASR